MSTAAIKTRTVTVNAAFLQEIKEVNQELWELLAECRRCGDAPIAHLRQGHQFVDLLRELRDKLALHFALEEAFGYFEDPIAVAPRLADRSAALRHAHGDLYLELATLVDEAEELLYERKLAGLTSTISANFAAFHHKLQAHESQEMELIQEAFGADLGVGD
jgi:hypothetical protein